MTTNEAAERLPSTVKIERCTQCGGPMQIEVIPGDDHESWVCPKDATAWAVDQEWAYSIGDDDEW